MGEVAAGGALPGGAGLGCAQAAHTRACTRSGLSPRLLTLPWVQDTHQLIQQAQRGRRRLPVHLSLQPALAVRAQRVAVMLPPTREHPGRVGPAPPHHSQSTNASMSGPLARARQW